MDEAHEAATIEPSLTQIGPISDENMVKIHRSAMGTISRSHIGTMVQMIWTTDKGKFHSEQRSSMDEAHQAGSIEPSLTKIRHKFDENEAIAIVPLWGVIVSLRRNATPAISPYRSYAINPT